MPARNEEIRSIACEWLDYLTARKEPTADAWKLYDLACGRRPEVIEVVRAWVAGMNQSKPKVKKVIEWLDK